jgi:hypothetical protein
MLYREIIAVCSEIHTKHINTLCGQNVEFVNVKPGGTYSDHWALVQQKFSLYQRRYICGTEVQRLSLKWTRSKGGSPRW